MFGMAMTGGRKIKTASMRTIKKLKTPANSNSYSILMDGTNDMLRQPDGNNIFDDLATGSWTLSFYIRFDTTTNQTIFWKGTYPSEYLWIACSAGGDIQIVGATGSTTTTINTVFNSNMSANTWHHVVMTSDGSGTNRANKCYIDGSEVSANSTTLIASSTNLESHTGTAKFTTSNLANLIFYKQYLDQIATWDSVLTAAEITAIYNNNPLLTSNSGDYTSSGDLQRYYKMDENTGTTAADSSGNGNAALTLFNGPTWSSVKPW
tara:strand:- start:165 stop:956 length:792 start_codon:yes stop_codon:yes gene_type:complete